MKRLLLRSSHTRTIRVDGRSYRYQDVAQEEEVSWHGKAVIYLR